MRTNPVSSGWEANPIAQNRALIDPRSISHLSPKEVDQRLEFVKREGNIEPYKDKVTGELLYHSRKTLSDKEIFQACFDTVWKNRRAPGEPADSSAAPIIRETITKLQGLAARNPESFEVALAMGMGWFTPFEKSQQTESDHGSKRSSILMLLRLSRYSIFTKPINPFVRNLYCAHRSCSLLLVRYTSTSHRHAC